MPWPASLSRSGLLLLAALLIAHTLALSWHLEADLPGDLDQSAGLIFDPPSKCHNARNQVLHGTWTVDDWTPVVHSPLHTLLQTGVFRLFGVRLLSVRLLDVFTSSISLLLFFLLARRCLPTPWAFTATFLAGTSPFLLVYGRSGLLEPLAIVFGLAATLAVTYGYEKALDSPRPWPTHLVFLGAGLLAGIAFLGKASAWPYALALLLLMFTRPPSRRWAVISFLAGLLIVAFGYLVFFVPAWAEHFQRETGYWTERAQSDSLFTRWMRQSLFGQTTDYRYLLALGVALMPLAFAGTRDPAGRARRIPLMVAALVFLFGSQFLSVLNYRPFRYALPYLPLTYLAATWALYRLARPPATDGPTLGWGLRLALFLSSLYALFFGLDPLVWAKPWRAWRPEAPLRFLLTAGVLAACFLILPRILRSDLGRRMRTLTARPLGLALAALLITATLTTGLHRYIRWAERPSYAMRDFSRKLGSDYQNLVIGGTTPLFSVMENRHHAVKITAYDLNHAWLTNGCLTHLLIPQGMGQERVFKHLIPETLKAALPIGYPLISGYSHVFYALTLQPLTAQRVSPNLLEVQNPDSYTPQTLLVVPAESEPHSVSLRPLERLQVPASSGEPPALFSALELLLAAEQTRMEPRTWAFERASPFFRATPWHASSPLVLRRKDDRPADHLFLRLRTDEPGPQILHLRLRALDTASAAPLEQTIGLTSETYALAVFPLDPSVRKWQLERTDGGTLWLDFAALATSEDQLRARIPAPP